jgi:hypothetical protein
MPIIRPLWNSESSGPRWPLPLRSAKGVRIGGIIGDKGRRVGGRETRFYAFSRKKTGTKRQGLYLTHDCILQPDYIFSVCVGLISLDESNDSFCFFHATAASYFHRLFTSQLDGHNNILHCSVAYLSMDYFSKSNFQVDSNIDIIDNHPLLDYVPLQFQYHYDHVMASNRQLAYDLLLSLLDTMNRFRSDCQVMYDEYENLTGGDSVPRRDEALRNMTKFGIHPLPEMICRHHVLVGGVYKWWSRRHHRFVAYKNKIVGPSSFGQIYGLANLPRRWGGAIHG